MCRSHIKKVSFTSSILITGTPTSYTFNICKILMKFLKFIYKNIYFNITVYYVYKYKALSVLNY